MLAKTLFALLDVGHLLFCIAVCPFCCAAPFCGTSTLIWRWWVVTNPTCQGVPLNKIVRVNPSLIRLYTWSKKSFFISVLFECWITKKKNHSKLPRCCRWVTLWFSWCCCDLHIWKDDYKLETFTQLYCKRLQKERAGLYGSLEALSHRHFRARAVWR